MRRLVSKTKGSATSRAEIARASGYDAFTDGEFAQDPRAQAAGFDSLLLSHAIEHLEEAEAAERAEPPR